VPNIPILIGKSVVCKYNNGPSVLSCGTLALIGLIDFKFVSALPYLTRKSFA